MSVIRYETSEQLHFELARLKVHRAPASRVYVPGPTRRSHVTDGSEAALVDREMPGSIWSSGRHGGRQIRRSSAGLSTGRFSEIAHGDQRERVPNLERQLEVACNAGRRSTIYDWMAAVADVVGPLYALMKQRVLQSEIIHTDNTLIDTSIRWTRTARFWAYLGDKDHPYEVYDFTE